MSGIVGGGNDFIRTLLQSGKAEDFICLYNYLDPDRKVSKMMKRIDQKQLRVILYSVGADTYVKILRRFSRFFNCTSHWRELYKKAKITCQKYKPCTMDFNIDSPLEMLSNYTGSTEIADMVNNVSSLYRDNPQGGCERHQAEELDSDEDSDVEENMAPRKSTNNTSIADISLDDNDDAFFEEYDDEIDEEAYQLLSEELRIELDERRTRRQLKLDEQYAAFKHFFRCFHQSMKSHPDIEERLRLCDETLFECKLECNGVDENGLEQFTVIEEPCFEWLCSKYWMENVDPNLDPGCYPHNSSSALEELKFMDEARPASKKRLPELFTALNNIWLILKFQEMVTDQCLEKLLKECNILIDDFLSGRITETANLHNQIVEKIKATMPDLAGMADEVKDLFMEAIYHNINKCKKEMERLQGALPGLASLAKSWGYNSLDPDAMQNYVTSKLDYICQERNRQRLDNNSNNSKASAPSSSST